MEKALVELRERLGEVYDLRAASGLLLWDRATKMPPKGAESRGRQTALLGRLAHERFTDPRVGELLDELGEHEKNLPYDSDEAALLRTTRRQYEREARKPADLVSRFSRHSAASYGAWAKARPADDFAAVRPFLEETLELSRELAGCFPESEHPADALIAVGSRHGRGFGEERLLRVARRARPARGGNLLTPELRRRVPSPAVPGEGEDGVRGGDSPPLRLRLRAGTP